MLQVAVLGTGGTIASVQADSGAVAKESVTNLVKNIPLPQSVRVTTKDIITIGSYVLTLKEQAQIVEAVLTAEADEAIAGIVVTHGTDAIEETAALVDLYSSRRKPIIFTGAQRAADLLNPDGPGNLRESIALASKPELASFGVIIYFAGLMVSAWNTRKTHTTAPRPFSGGQVVGEYYNGHLFLTSETAQQRYHVAYNSNVANTKIDIHHAYPGSDAALIEVAAQRGAHGHVLAGMGMGNVHPDYLPVIQELLAAGKPVVLSTRVPGGPLIATYGNGGAGDLRTAGVILSQLNPYQSRILLAAAVASEYTMEDLKFLFEK